MDVTASVPKLGLSVLLRQKVVVVGQKPGQIVWVGVSISHERLTPNDVGSTVDRSIVSATGDDCVGKVFVTRAGKLRKEMPASAGTLTIHNNYTGAQG
ncbi:hypothetical protein KAR91_07600 [Candidatus Pacearchaeota archaeon]|nr:hypothetical protein [Candidatus Pacearchaeota archaeon]